MSNIIKEKILSVFVYQAVSFERKPHKTFYSVDINDRPSQNIEILESLGLVKISSDKDAVLIPFANVAAINLDTNVKEEERENKKQVKSKVSTGVRPQDIPRPR